MTDKATDSTDPRSADHGKDTKEPDLDSLLASYGKDGNDDGAKKPSLEDEVRELREQNALRDYQDTMSKEVIPTLRGDLDIQLPDDYVEHWVNRQAGEDERLMKLWDNRRSNPGAFKEAISALAPKFQKHVEDSFGIKSEARGGKRKLASAVRGSRETSPTSAQDFDDVDWAGLTDQGFELKKREVFKAAERGDLN